MANLTAVNTPPVDKLANLGDEIRQLRKIHGLTLEQMADATGKSVGFLSQVERNITRPSVAALQKISEALDIHIGWFFLLMKPNKAKTKSSSSCAKLTDADYPTLP